MKKSLIAAMLIVSAAACTNAQQAPAPEAPVAAPPAQAAAPEPATTAPAAVSAVTEVAPQEVTR